MKSPFLLFFTQICSPASVLRVERLSMLFQSHRTVRVGRSSGSPRPTPCRGRVTWPGATGTRPAGFEKSPEGDTPRLPGSCSRALPPSAGSCCSSREEGQVGAGVLPRAAGSPKAEGAAAGPGTSLRGPEGSEEQSPSAAPRSQPGCLRRPRSYREFRCHSDVSSPGGTSQATAVQVKGLQLPGEVK